MSEYKLIGKRAFKPANNKRYLVQVYQNDDGYFYAIDQYHLIKRGDLVDFQNFVIIRASDKYIYLRVCMLIKESSFAKLIYCLNDIRINN